VKAAKGTLLITADHGNCEVLIERDKNGAPLFDAHGVAVPKKSHTLSPVPFIAIDYSTRTITSGGVSDAGISNIAATILALLGQPIPTDYRHALLSVS
jgi:2,3-bisphosphoglycerate-independent phosphoglycerate mutase